MKTNLLILDIKLVLLIAFSLAFLTNCQKPPTSDFSYMPSVNPEAGDTIKFSNLSANAVSYDWDFGNGNGSIDESPFTIYEESGNIDVTLTASNEAGSNSITKTLTIEEPTVLGFFVYEYDSTLTLTDDAVPLSNCEIWIYDNEEDWKQFITSQFLGQTDDDGIVYFYNLEAQIYYIITYKETPTGVWLSGGTIPELKQNEYNLFTIPSMFNPDETKKSFQSKIDALKLNPLELKDQIFNNHKPVL